MRVRPWFVHEGTRILHVGDEGAYTYVTSRVVLDADGAPRAYHPDGVSGLDALANAGFPDGGWRSVLVVDPDDPDRPFVQPNGPDRGFFVCMTSLRDPDLPDTDPRKYVDSTRIPYVVFPGAFHALTGTGTWGDLALVRDLNEPDKQSVAIVADAGPKNAPLGEMSLRLAEELGGRNPNPRTGAGAPRGSFQYVVFPSSRRRPPWRRTLEDLQEQGGQLLERLGGWPDV